MQAECRDYVDDITVFAREYDHRYTIPFFHEQLSIAKIWLTQNNMVLNQKKEQIYANNAKFKQEWETRYPEYPGELVEQCKDLGVCHRSGRVTNHIVIERTSKCESICKTNYSLPVNIERKAYMAGAIVLGGAL